MYRKVHEDLLQTIYAKNDFRLKDRRPNLGLALKLLKDEKRIPTQKLAAKAGLNANLLKSLIRMGEINTSSERFVKLVKALGVPSDEFIRLARENAHYNFYRLKEDQVPHFSYRSHEVEVYSSPSFSRKDFLWTFVRIHPNKGIHDLIHQTMDQAAGFVTHGRLSLHYGAKKYSIHTNQCFFLDPKTSHSFVNESATEQAGFYLLYQPKPEPKLKQETRGRKSSSTPISASSLIEQIRKELSPDPDHLLPMPMLAHLSGIDLDSLMHLTYKKAKIIPFEKIDRLARLTDYSFDSIIQKSENRYDGWVSIVTDEDKSTIDLSARHGVRFTNHAGIGLGKRSFTVADITLDSWREGQSRKEWRYQGIGFAGISVQRGYLGIQYV